MKINELMLCKHREPDFQRCLFKYRQICRAIYQTLPEMLVLIIKTLFKRLSAFLGPEETIEPLGLGNANTVNATEKEISKEVNEDIFKDIS